MSLSARDQRILSEIACQLSAAEPRLARALAAGRLPSLRRRLLAARSRRRPVQSIWLAPVVIITSLATGIALLTAGLVLGILVLCYVGAVLVQFGPAACAYLYMRAPRVPPIARHALLLVGQPGAGAEQAQLGADHGLTVKRLYVTAGERVPAHLVGEDQRLGHLGCQPSGRLGLHLIPEACHVARGSAPRGRR